MAVVVLTFQRYLKQAALAVVTIAGFQPSAFAQARETFVGKSWSFFLERCSLAFSEPQRYLDEIAAGKGNFSSTSDGSIIMAGTTGLQLHDTFQIVEVGNYRRHECYAMGMFDGDVTAPEALNKDFERHVNQPGITVTGGRSSKELDKFYPIIAYRYVVVGALPHDIVATVTIAKSVIEIQSYYVLTED